jgi:hypothetical protein
VKCCGGQRAHTELVMAFEWDAAKAESNFEKHGVSFSEAMGVFEIC